MGKKAKLKAIRRIAATLPQIPVKAIERTVMSGQQLIDAGVTKVENEPVSAGKEYISKKVVAVPVNHLNLMKKAYNKYGHAGINGYLNQVDDYVEQRKKLVDADHS